MAVIKLQSSCLKSLSAAAVVWIVCSGSASAQYGMGMGLGGMFFGGFRSVPPPIDFLNQHSLQAAARGMQGPTQNRAYGPGSNSFHNKSRDPGFVSTGEISRRRFSTSSGQQVARASTPTQTQSPPRASTTKPAQVPAQAPALASFFDAAFKLVWPNEAPVAGDLGAKREISDEASLFVLQETRRDQSASLSSVTVARQKLLDYGRPALQEIRSTQTAPIADSFHRFLLSLYDSLGQSSRAN